MVYTFLHIRMILNKRLVYIFNVRISSLHYNNNKKIKKKEMKTCLNSNKASTFPMTRACSYYWILTNLLKVQP